jgi:proteasome accessory factor C
MASARAERLLNVVTLLLNEDSVTLERIIANIPGYSADKETARGEFKRDRKNLAEEGFPVETMVRPGSKPGEADHFGYRIAPERYQAPDPGLSDDELHAVRAALASIDLSGDVDTFALWKLGGDDALVDRGLGGLALPAAAGTIAEAIAQAAVVSFDYRGRRHRVSPVGLLLRRANFYLSAQLIDSDRRLTFRVDRIDPASLVVEEPGTAVIPLDWNPDDIVPADPWAIGTDEPIAVDVEVRGALARWVQSTLRPGSVISETADAVVVRLDVSHYDAFRTWLVGLGDDARVVAPATIVERVVADLLAIGGEQPTPLASSRHSKRTDASTPPPALRWLRRTLGVLTYLAERNEPVLISELSSRFSATPSDVVDDLLLAACCGIPPFEPGDLYDIELSDDETSVQFRPAPWMSATTASRLTGEELVALQAAGSVLAAVAPAEQRQSLQSAMSKLTNVLGVSGHLRVVLDAPPHLGVLQAAVSEHLLIRIDHISFARRTLREGRLVEPIGVVLDEGRWYLDALDADTHDRRRFRVDRIVAVDPTDEHFTPLKRLPARRAWPPKDAVTAVLSAPASASWVGEVHPATVTPDGDGRVRIELAVGEWEWLATLCLQIGAGIEVLEPLDRQSLPRDAAARILSRYHR